MTPTALLMLKAPVAGEVKTRLGREIGMGAACEIYRRLVEHQLRQIPAGWRKQVCYAPMDALQAMRGWLGGDLHYSPQGEGDLGARLTRAVAHHFAEIGGPLLVLGGDCPYLDAPTLLNAEAELIEAEAVLVPAADGGYCLIGLRGDLPAVFHEITWSTDRVMEETRQRLRRAGTCWAEMETMEDVDDAGSWQRTCAAFPELAGASS